MIPHGTNLPISVSLGELFVKDDEAQGSKLYVGGAHGWELVATVLGGGSLDSFTTDDLDEGSTNLYFSGKTTDDLAEGSTNKYFATALAVSAIASGFKLAVAALPADGAISASTVYAVFDATNGAPAISFKGKTADGTVFSFSLPLISI